MPELRELHRQKVKRHQVQRWPLWAPVFAGMLLAMATPFIERLIEPIAPWGSWLVFPFVHVAGLHELGLSDELTRTLPQLMRLLQFPLEGLIVRFGLRSGNKLSTALGQIGFLHGIALLVLWLLSQPLVAPTGSTP